LGRPPPGMPAVGIPKLGGFHRYARVVRPVVISGSMTRRRFEWTSTRWISTPQKPVLASWVYFDRQRFALGLPRIAQRLDRLDGLFAFGVDLAADHARDLVPDVIDIDGLVPVGGETAGLLRSAEQVGLI
jgi:hypothetical protein